MFKTKKFIVNGEEYECTQLGALEGRAIWLKLVKLAGSGISALAKAPKLDERAVGDALAGIIGDLDAATLTELCDVFGRSCRVRKGADKWPQVSEVFDVHFAGSYVSMTTWLWECVKLNFGTDFLGGTGLAQRLRTLAGDALEKATAEPSSTQGPA